MPVGTLIAYLVPLLIVEQLVLDETDVTIKPAGITETEQIFVVDPDVEGCWIVYLILLGQVESERTAVTT